MSLLRNTSSFMKRMERDTERRKSFRRSVERELSNSSARRLQKSAS